MEVVSIHEDEYKEFVPSESVKKIYLDMFGHKKLGRMFPLIRQCPNLQLVSFSRCSFGKTLESLGLNVQVQFFETKIHVPTFLDTTRVSLIGSRIPPELAFDHIEELVADCCIGFLDLSRAHRMKVLDLRRPEDGFVLPPNLEVLEMYHWEKQGFLSFPSGLKELSVNCAFSDDTKIPDSVQKLELEEDDAIAWGIAHASGKRLETLGLFDASQEVLSKTALPFILQNRGIKVLGIDQDTELYRELFETCFNLQEFYRNPADDSVNGQRKLRKIQALCKRNAIILKLAKKRVLTWMWASKGWGCRDVRLIIAKLIWESRYERKE